MKALSGRGEQPGEQDLVILTLRADESSELQEVEGERKKDL
jgi:hypothetical protein